MKGVIALISAGIICLTARAEVQEYAAELIPETLKSAANAVVRKDDQKMVIEAGGDITHTRIYAITILEESGEDLASFYGPYDKYTRLRSVTGKLFDKDGSLVKKLRGDDVLDVSTISSFSLYEDSRAKIVDPEYHGYPYTVEYTVHYVLRSFLDLPDWTVYPAFNVAVEEATFEVIAPTEDAFRYTTRQIDLDPLREETNEGYRFTWKVNQMPALIHESVTRGIRDISPVLYIGPHDFNYAGYDGNMSSWEDFGRWIFELGEGSRELSNEEASRIRTVAAGANGVGEKVGLLYKYMQDKVRYVNLSLGIGGYAPIPAAEVSDAGYGDCKGLSNYMQAILEVVGIPSFYTLVRSGNHPPRFIEDFPSQQFNHVILAVPLPSDTIWLECTSQRYPAGYLGSNTDDRPVLFVTSEGGILSRTPGFEDGENCIKTVGHCVLDDQANADITFEKEYRGIYFGSKLLEIQEYDIVEQKRRIQGELSFNDFTVNDFKYETVNDPVTMIQEEVSVSAKAITLLNNEQIPLQLSQFSSELGLPSRTRNRRFPVYLRRGIAFQDSIVYSLPENLSVHFLPESVEMETPFGKYSMKVEMEGSDLHYTRYVVLNPGEYEAEQFSDFYRFVRQIRNADQKKVILVHN